MIQKRVSITQVEGVMSCGLLFYHEQAVSQSDNVGGGKTLSGGFRDTAPWLRTSGVPASIIALPPEFWRVSKSPMTKGKRDVNLQWKEPLKSFPGRLCGLSFIILPNLLAFERYPPSFETTEDSSAECCPHILGKTYANYRRAALHTLYGMTMRFLS